MKEFHYSISLMEQNSGYQPREADERVGYFTTVYRDLGKSTEKEKWIRYINRWHLEKRDPKLTKSPPKEPIVFYIESSVPVRYRRWVREALLEWNKAFEKVGIVGAIEVYQQDEETGAHMEKDPEAVGPGVVAYSTWSQRLWCELSEEVVGPEWRKQLKVGKKTPRLPQSCAPHLDPPSSSLKRLLGRGTGVLRDAEAS